MSAKKRKVVMIHGSSGRDRREDVNYVEPNKHHWHGWFAEKLVQNGFDVQNPKMPTDWNPKYHEWREVIEKLDVDNETVLIGVSAGGTFILRWLQETGREVQSVVLVAPGYFTEQKGEDRLKAFYDFDLNAEIRSQFKELTIFISNDRPARVKSAHFYAEQLQGKLVELKEREHFVLKDNPSNARFPELLNEILGVRED